MTNQVTTTQSNVPTSYHAPTQEVLNTDILIPRLLLMQGLSDYVSERKAQQGDMIRSTTIEKLGNDSTAPVDFIPLKITMEYREEEKVMEKFKFRRSVPRTHANENLPWTFYRNPQGQDFDKPGVLGATEWRRVKVINCFALLPQDIDAFQVEMARVSESGEMPDLTKTVLPVMISFKSTSFNAGKSVSTFFAQVEEMKQHAPGVRAHAYTLPLTCAPDKNDKGNYFVFKVGSPKKLDAKYLPQAERWLNTLHALKEIKIDDSGDDSETVEGSRF